MIDAARRYCGTPFRHQARLPGVGLDCVGLIVCAAEEAGISIAAPIDYAAIPDPVLLLESLIDRCDRIDRSELQLGDIVCFRIYCSKPRHLAIVSNVDPLMIVHAYARAEKVAEHFLDDRWEALMHSCWRLRSE